MQLCQPPKPSMNGSQGSIASQPYYNYINDEQYVYQLHCIGQGHYNIENIRIEDTPITSFTEITYMKMAYSLMIQTLF